MIVQSPHELPQDELYAWADRINEDWRDEYPGPNYNGRNDFSINDWAVSVIEDNFHINPDTNKY